MGIYQAYNKKINSWVKYEFSKDGFKPLDVKQVNTTIPFKNIKIRGKKK